MTSSQELANAAAYMMESSVNEQAAFGPLLHVQRRDARPTIVRTWLETGTVVVVTCVNLINIVTKQCNLDENKLLSECEVCDTDSDDATKSNVTELKWTGKAYMCGKL